MKSGARLRLPAQWTLQKELEEEQNEVEAPRTISMGLFPPVLVLLVCLFLFCFSNVLGNTSLGLVRNSEKIPRKSI